MVFRVGGRCLDFDRPSLDASFQASKEVISQFRTNWNRPDRLSATVKG